MPDGAPAQTLGPTGRERRVGGITVPGAAIDFPPPKNTPRDRPLGVFGNAGSRVYQ